MKKIIWLFVILGFLFFVLSSMDRKPSIMHEKVVQTVRIEPQIDVFTRVANSIDSGMSAKALWVSAQLESSGNPNARSGSHIGLINMGEEEFKQYGPTYGDRADPLHNLIAASHYAKANVSSLREVLKRHPKEAEIYLSLQQGRKGAIDLFSNPKARAIHVRTRDAILGNVPDGLKKQAEKWTCERFTQYWIDRFNTLMEKDRNEV